MKKIISTLALSGLLLAPCMNLCAEEALVLETEKKAKPKVKLSKKQRKKISQKVLGDLKKQKAWNHLDWFLTLVALGSPSALGVDRLLCDEKEEWLIPAKPILWIAATAALLKIPVKLKRMDKEGYYVGLNPAKLVWNGIKFQVVDMWT